MNKVISFDLDGTLVHGRFGDMVWHHGIPEKYAWKHGITMEEAQARILKEYEVEHYWRDAKVFEIFEGTKEVEKMLIGKKILGRF